MLTVWCNGGFTGEAARMLAAAVAPGVLVEPETKPASILESAPADPSLTEAEIVFGQPDPDALMRSSRVKWVHITTAGYTRYDREDFRRFLQERGVLFTNSSEVFDEPCAEHAMAFVLAFARQLPAAILDQTERRPWNTWAIRRRMFLLEGQTILILGYGAIAKRLCVLLQPFGARILVVRRHAAPIPGLEVFGQDELPSLLPQADHVFNILPDAPATRQFCGAKFFAAMDSAAYFYNLGRGTTVDQEALADALNSEKLAGAYLDVTDPEPLPPEHFLNVAKNCHITPHIAGGHNDESERLVQYFAANLVRFRENVPLEGAVRF